MSQYNNNSAKVQAFKEYQAIPEEVENALDEFSDWVHDNWEWKEGVLPQNDEDMIVIIQDAVEKYLKRDTVSQELVKAGEQELLAKWSKNATN